MRLDLVVGCRLRAESSQLCLSMQCKSRNFSCVCCVNGKESILVLRNLAAIQAVGGIGDRIPSVHAADLSDKTEGKEIVRRPCTQM